MIFQIFVWSFSSLCSPFLSFSRGILSGVWRHRSLSKSDSVCFIRFFFLNSKLSKQRNFPSPFRLSPAPVLFQWWSKSSFRNRASKDTTGRHRQRRHYHRHRHQRNSWLHRRYRGVVHVPFRPRFRPTSTSNSSRNTCRGFKTVMPPLTVRRRIAIVIAVHVLVDYSFFLSSMCRSSSSASSCSLCCATYSYTFRSKIRQIRITLV